MLKSIEDVRRALRKEIGKEPRADIWEEMLKRGYVAESISEDEIKIVLDFYREQSERYFREPKGQVPKTHHQIEPDEKMKYLSEIMLWDSAHEPEVIKFRKEVLKDNLIPPNEAQNWIRQKIEEELKNGNSEFFNIRKPRPDLVLVNQDLSKVRTHEIQQGSEFIGLQREDRYGANYYLPQQGGILDSLQNAGEILRSKYRWTENNSMLFILSGVKPPPVSLAYGNVDLNKSYPSLNSIAVDLPIYLSSHEMGEICSIIKTALFPSNKKRNKPMTEKHLKLAVFYHTHKELKLAEMMKAWNKANSEFKKYNFVTLFGRDAKSAYERLIGLK